MKNLLYLTTIALVVLMGTCFSACGSDDDSSDDVDNGQYPAVEDVVGTWYLMRSDVKEVTATGTSQTQIAYDFLKPSKGSEAMVSFESKGNIAYVFRQYNYNFDTGKWEISFTFNVTISGTRMTFTDGDGSATINFSGETCTIYQIQNNGSKELTLTYRLVNRKVMTGNTFTVTN